MWNKVTERSMAKRLKEIYFKFVTAAPISLRNKTWIFSRQETDINAAEMWFPSAISGYRLIFIMHQTMREDNFCRILTIVC